MLAEPYVRDWSLWHPELATVLTGLLMSAYCFTYGAKARLRALGLGYIAVRRSELVSLYDQSRPAYERVLSTMLSGVAPPIPATGEACLGALGALAASPLTLTPGPGVLLSDDGWVALDFAALTQRFEQVLEFPALSGAGANVRGFAFEASFQSWIDGTSWSPPDSLRAYIGKHLKAGGKYLGEVDAIAHKQGVTLLVSCKSITVGAPYVLGDHAARREAAEKVTKALARWTEFLSSLVAEPTPVNGNFDLSDAGQLIGVVTTPNVVTIPIDQAVRPSGLSGLPQYASAEELLRWFQLH
jgi:hypothetical protein